MKKSAKTPSPTAPAVVKKVLPNHPGWVGLSYAAPVLMDRHASGDPLRVGTFSPRNPPLPDLPRLFTAVEVATVDPSVRTCNVVNNTNYGRVYRTFFA